MPTYFRKTIKLLPGVTLNLNKTGPSLSIGPRGAKINISKKGVYFNSSIRGTGIYNKTKIGSSLLWGLGAAIATIAIGYGLGIALQNFNLFVGMVIASIPVGIIAFFISKSKAKVETGLDEEDEEDEEVAEVPSRSKKSTRSAGRAASGRRAQSTTRKPESSPRKTDGGGAKRTASAPAKAYVSAVEQLVEKMAEADTLEALNKAHNEILDIMYTNIKPLGVTVLDMEFDEALAAIEQDYAEGVRQIKADGDNPQ